MPLLKSLLKLTGGPGSILFCFLCAAFGVWLDRRGGTAQRVGRAWLASLAALYFVLSLPIVANQLADTLTSSRPLVDPAQLGHVETLVVLDGDNRRGRVREARRLYDAVHPALVIVSGAQWMVDGLIEAGIPARVIVHDTVPETTREQLEQLRGMDAAGTVVVASRLQIPRIVQFSESMGLSMRLAPAPLDAEPAFSGVWALVPSYLALRKSRDALYEHIAQIYYRSCASEAC